MTHSNLRESFNLTHYSNFDCAGVAQPGLECQSTPEAILIIWRSWVRNPPPALHSRMQY